MKLSRITAVGATAALVVGSTVLLAAPASAETVVGDITFYEESDFGVENPSGTWPDASTTDWFFGAVSGAPGTATFDSSGLSINAGAAGDVQILNQNVGAQPTSVSELTSMVGSFRVYSDTDDWTFQLPVFGNASAAVPGDREFTTLRPVAQGDVTAGADWANEPNAWRTTWAIPGGVGYAAGDTASFTELVTALLEGADPTVLAYGMFFDPADTPTIQGTAWTGEFSAFGIGTVPTRSISTPTLAEATSTGVTFSGTAWFPGSEMYLEVENPAGDIVYSEGLTGAIAAADGTISFTLVLPADSPAGEYTAVYFDDDGLFYAANLFFEDMTFEIAETTPAAGPEPLPATGAEPMGAIVIAAGMLLLGGIAFSVVRVRRS